jgi:hypothetical protein
MADREGMKTMRVLFWGAVAAFAAGAAACGSTVGTSGTGGTGNYPCSPPDDQACCETSPDDICCRTCGSTVTSSSSGTGGAGGTGGTGGVGATGGGGGTGGSKQCGGIAGLLCAADEYCDYGDDRCGGDDGLGECKPRPLGCPDSFMPTCACDGQVYGNPCDANAAGQDVSNLGGCVAPPGTFGCGSKFCDVQGQYCQRATSDVVGIPDGYTCLPLPGACANGASCACLAGEPCSDLCDSTADGGFVLTCPGG